MKGIVFDLFEEVIVARHGAHAWNALLETAGLKGGYTALGSYDDEDLHLLVSTAARALAMEPDAMLRWFGQRAMPILSRRFPAFFETHTSTRGFLLSLNGIIHPEVRQLHPGANVPFFDFRDGDDGALLMGYHSSRGLCSLAQGLTEGAAGLFGESLDFRHLACVHRGDASCLFHIGFQTLADPAMR
ncbi:MAG TPA: heme NO-binding domain-containing protein [Xanthomonadaceae bacterium]|jgi:hypothetical protein